METEREKKQRRIIESYNDFFENLKITGIVTPALDLSLYGIDKKDQKTIFLKLRKLLNLTSSNSGEDGDSDGNNLVLLLDLYHNKQAVLKSLYSLLGANLESDLTSKIRKLIKIIERSYAEKEIDKEILETTAYTSLTAPLMTPLNEILDRNYRYREFIYNRSINPSYFPTLTPFINTDAFNNLTRPELVGLFDSNTFYQMTMSEIEMLMQTTVNEYCLSEGVQPCAVIIKDLPMQENYVCNGFYEPNMGAIYINRKLIEKIASTNSTDVGYLILSTLIHESRHRIQFSNIEKYNSLDAKSKLVVDSLSVCQDGLDFGTYLSCHDELDARNESLRYLREMASDPNCITSEAIRNFYNIEKTLEMQSPKNNIPNNLKSLYPDIYDGKLLDQQCTNEPTC